MKINLNYKKTARIISMMCGLLFTIFSLVYLYVFQTDILEAVHFSLAHGKTVFSPLGSSLIVTVILLVISLLISKFWNIRGSWQAFAYIPSFIILASFTDVRRGIYTVDYSSYNFWLYSSLFVGSLLLLFLMRSSFAHSVKRGLVHPSVYMVNVLCFLVLALLTAMVGTTDKLYHNELQAEALLRKGDNYNALMVAHRSKEASRTLTALRALALAKEGLMGEKLFEYPQYYRADGLTFSADSLTTLRYNNDSIKSGLGLPATTLLSDGAELGDYCRTDSCTEAAVDYYLSALLLEKKLDSFVEALPLFYDCSRVLPKHYLEALMMFEHLHHKTVERNTEIQQYFKSYLEGKKKYHHTKHEKNLMKLSYDKTYWWYFDYQQ